jgi:hypothetical protein
MLVTGSVCRLRLRLVKWARCGGVRGGRDAIGRRRGDGRAGGRPRPVEVAEECGRAETVCGGGRVGWLEFEAVPGDEAGRVGLGGEVVVECDCRRPELGLDGGQRFGRVRSRIRASSLVSRFGMLAAYAG